MYMLPKLYKSIQNLLAPTPSSVSPTEIPKFTLAKYRLASSPNTPSDILAKLAHAEPFGGIVTEMMIHDVASCESQAYS